MPTGNGTPAGAGAGAISTADSESVAEAGRNARDSTYRLDAEITFSGDRLLLYETITACPDATFRLEVQGPAQDSHCPRYVCVADGDEDEVRGALARDPTVAESRCVSRFAEETIYRIWRGSDAVGVVATANLVDAYVKSCRGGVAGWTVRMHLPNRETLRELNATCARAGVSVAVGHLGNLRSVAVGDRTTLSAAQRELLTAAEELGYFEVPRGVSQRELAERFDVTPSAISQQLRNAIGALISGTISA